MSEKGIQNAILREFGTRPDMRLWRANVGVGRFGHRVVQFGIPGQADLTGILPGGLRLEIEIKAPNGRQTEEQKCFQRMIERFGGVYVLARTVLVADDSPMRIGPGTTGTVYHLVDGEWKLSSDRVTLPEGWYVVPPRFVRPGDFEGGE